MRQFFQLSNGLFKVPAPVHTFKLLDLRIKSLFGQLTWAFTCKRRGVEARGLSHGQHWLNPKTSMLIFKTHLSPGCN